MDEPIEVIDMRMRNGGTWGEHPDHTVEDWQFQVENDETRQGYWEWVVSRTEEEE